MMTDPGIMLFGMKIGLPETPKTTNLPPFTATIDKIAFSDERDSTEDGVADKTCSSSHKHQRAMFTPQDQEKDDDDGKEEDKLDDNPKTPSIDEDGMSENLQTTGTEEDTMNLQPRILKKPDKILPCPRCDSMITKFCYFNNSNVNQPRHFCKSCQRYWTAGGTMRNMPVGAGRRKKKNPSSHCRFIISQEALESAAAANHIEFAPDSDGVPPKVVTFSQNSSRFGTNLSGRENQNDCSSSSVVDKVEKMQDNGFHSQVHWIQGASWPYNPWNRGIPIPMPIPAICPPGYPPMPMYPSPYWSSVSWLPPTGSILGKHLKDGEAIEPTGSHEGSKKQRNSILIPKTLRIDDPDEAAKSSIWATLGIKNENCSRGDLFKAFQAKGKEKEKHTAAEPSPMLQANPAAFSRSLLFQERA